MKTRGSFTVNKRIGLTIADGPFVAVAVAVPATGVALSTAWMERTWMALGQAAGTAAHLSLDLGCALSDIPSDALQAALRPSGQVVDAAHFVEGGNSMNDIVITAPQLADFCAAILVGAGAAKEEARCVATHLVRANLTGHDSHGVSKLPRYIDMMAEGELRPGQSVTVREKSAAHLLLDGNAGFGQTIGEQAVDMGCAQAAENGACVAVLGNSGHLGRIGGWAERAAAAGLASIHMVSIRGRSLVAPFGAIDRRQSTSPFCIGVPTGDRPLILDFATSTVAEGKALVAAQGGKPLPEDALVSGDGDLTSDPAQLYGDTLATPSPDPSAGPGALTAFGRHKGSGLGILIEVLAGGLSGTGANRTFLDETEHPFRNAMLSIYIDPARFAGRDYLAEQALAYGEYVRSARPARGADKVRMPGRCRGRDRSPPQHPWPAPERRGLASPGRHRRTPWRRRPGGELRPGR